MLAGLAVYLRGARTEGDLTPGGLRRPPQWGPTSAGVIVRPKNRNTGRIETLSPSGLTASLVRSFDDRKEPAQFAESWLPMHVRIVDESGQATDAYSFLRAIDEKEESALRPFKNADGSDALCPFCSAPEALVLADDECLHACETCDRHWYIDESGNALPADRCPVCESPDVKLDDDSNARACGACGHRFFFDGLTYVDPATVESDGESC